MLMSASPLSPAFDEPTPPYSHHPSHAHMHAYNPYPRPASIKRESSHSPLGSLASSNPDLWPLQTQRRDGDATSRANGSLSTPVDGATRPGSPASTASTSSLVLFPTTSGELDGADTHPTIRPHSSASLHTYARPHSLFALPEDQETAETMPVHSHAGYSTDDASRRESSMVRRRSSKACDQCRKSKCKCERTAPSEPCQNCTLLRVPCTSFGPSRKRGPPKGYIDALEARLHQAEAIIGALMMSGDARATDLISSISQDELASIVLGRIDDSAYGASGRARGLAMPSKRPLAKSEEEVEELPVPLGQTHPTQGWQEKIMTLMRGSRRDDMPSVGMVSPPESPTDATWTRANGDAAPRYFGASSGLTLLGAPPHAPADLQESGLPHVTTDSASLRCDTETHAVLDAYRLCVHPFLPIVDPSQLDAWADGPAQDAVTKALFFATLACGASASVGSSQADTFAAYALSYLHPARSSPREVQTLLLLAYASLSSSPSRAWTLSGQATRLAMDLGMHRAQPSTSAQYQESRRIWGVCAILDALTAAATGRPPIISARDSDVPPPDLGTASTFALVFTASTALAAILSRALSTLYTARCGASSAAMTELVGALERWRTSLPAHLHPISSEEKESHYARETEGMWVMYWVTVELMSRRPNPTDGARVVINRCWRPAQALTKLAQRQLENGMLNWVPYAVFRAGLVWRDTVRMGDVEGRRELDTVLDILRKMGSMHSIAGRYAELLASTNGVAPIVQPKLSALVVHGLHPDSHAFFSPITPISPASASSNSSLGSFPRVPSHLHQQAPAPTPLRPTLPFFGMLPGEDERRDVLPDSASALARRRGKAMPNYATTPTSAKDFDCGLDAGYVSTGTYGAWGAYSREYALPVQHAPDGPAPAVFEAPAPEYWNAYTSPQSALAMNYSSDAGVAAPYTAHAHYQPQQPDADGYQQQRMQADVAQHAYYTDYPNNFGVQ